MKAMPVFFQSCKCLHSSRSSNPKGFSNIEAALAIGLLMLGITLAIGPIQAWNEKILAEENSDEIMNFVELVKDEVYHLPPNNLLFSVGSHNSVLGGIPRPDGLTRLDAQVTAAVDNGGAATGYKLIRFTAYMSQEHLEFILYKESP